MGQKNQQGQNQVRRKYLQQAYSWKDLLEKFGIKKTKSTIKNCQQDPEVGHHWDNLCLANIMPSIQPKVLFKPSVGVHL